MEESICLPCLFSCMGGEHTRFKLVGEHTRHILVGNTPDAYFMT